MFTQDANTHAFMYFHFRERRESREKKTESGGDDKHNLKDFCHPGSFLDSLN